MPIITQQAELPRASAVQPTQTLRQPDNSEKVAAVPSLEATTESSEEQLSPKFAALARREKALMRKAQEFKAREEALLAKEKEYSSGYVRKDQLIERAKSDPLGYLEEVNVTPDQFTQALLNASPQDHMIRKLEAKIQGLEEKLNKTDTSIVDQQKQQYDQAVRQIRKEATALVASDPTFETVKQENAEEAIVELIEKVYNDGWEDKQIEKGTILSVKDAAEHVENFLFERALKIAQLNKVKSKLSEPVEAQAPTQQQQLTQKQPMKTVTNTMTATTPTTLSARERRERAIAAFKGQLK